MKWIGTHHRLWRMPFIPEGLEKRRAQIHAYCLNLSGVFRAHFVEEPVECRGVLAPGSTHYAAAVLVDDQGQILVVLAPTDFIDANAEQSIEPLSFIPCSSKASARRQKDLLAQLLIPSTCLELGGNGSPIPVRFISLRYPELSPPPLSAALLAQPLLAKLQHPLHVS